MKITVFTPTYNRAHTLHKLYMSLRKQTFSDFEWLVIDDGSTDNTNQHFQCWISEPNSFPIRYYKVENGGKHRAINRATELAQGELFFIVDSDDYLTDEALEEIMKWEGTLQNKESYCAVSGNKGKSKNMLWGTTFNGEYLDSTNLERNKHNITGDKAEIYYTNILKNYKFDEFEGEKFITERIVWDRIAFDGYKIRYFNKIIYICDYLEDGLTKSGDKIFSENPRGTACLVKQQIKYHNHNIKHRLSAYSAYYRLVKGYISLKDAASYLEIDRTTLVLSIFLTKSKDFIWKILKTNKEVTN